MQSGDADRFLMIPLEVAHDPRVDWPAKIVWAAVYGYTRGGGTCWLSLESMAELCQRSRRQVSDYLKQLRDLGWIEIAGVDGRRRLLIAHLPSIATDRDDSDRPPLSRPTATIATDREADSRPTARQTGDGPPPIKKAERITEKKNPPLNVPTKKDRPSDLDEVRTYFAEIGGSDPDQFFDYWTSTGWRRRSGPVKDWRATARTWVRNARGRGDRSGRMLDTASASRWVNQ